MTVASERHLSRDPLFWLVVSQTVTWDLNDSMVLRLRLPKIVDSIENNASNTGSWEFPTCLLSLAI